MSTIFRWWPDDLRAPLESCDRDDATGLVARHFPPGCSVLECGCGLGRFVRYLVDRGHPTVGIEFAGDTLRDLHAAWPDLAVLQGDAARTPFAADHFDAVLSLGLVEHWPEGPRPALREHLRVLKPGGVALLTVPLHNAVRRAKRRLWFDELAGLPRALTKRILRGQSLRPNRLRAHPYAVFPAYGDFYEHRLTPREFRDAVRDAGFEIVLHQPIAHLDGVYHQLNPMHVLVGFQQWRFHPTPVAAWLNERLSAMPSFPAHMQAIVARKPDVA